MPSLPPLSCVTKQLSTFVDAFTKRTTLPVQILAALGALTLSSNLIKSFSFLFLPHLLPSRLGTFKRQAKLEGRRAWAIVTGASDGIGKGFVFELAAQGYDVVLLGRNKAKLEAVVAELKLETPVADTKIFVADAGDVYKKGDGVIHFDALLKLVAKLPVTVLINNVGMAHDLIDLEKLPADEIVKLISVNDTFPTLITQHLIPVLEKNGPSLILNVGSYASELALPYMSVYCGSKAYNKAWSQALAVELKARNSKIQVQSLLVAGVNSNLNKVKVSLINPSSRQFARTALRVPTTAKVAAPFFWHKVTTGFASFVPDFLLDRIVAMQVGSMRKTIGSEAVLADPKKKH